MLFSKNRLARLFLILTVFYYGFISWYFTGQGNHVHEFPKKDYLLVVYFFYEAGINPFFIYVFIFSALCYLLIFIFYRKMGSMRIPAVFALIMGDGLYLFFMLMGILDKGPAINPGKPMDDRTFLYRSSGGGLLFELIVLYLSLPVMAFIFTIAGRKKPA